MEAKEYGWETSCRRRIEEQNAENRRFAAMTGSLARRIEAIANMAA
jgi:hypothetical protein